jgi:hypothetical protein
MKTEATEQIVKVFYCYAREDKNLRDQLDAHLTPLRRSGRIRTWCDRQIEPGTNWQEAIDKNLETADLILILVSAPFMASDYCWSKEMKRALERHKAGDAHVVPVILRPVMWKETPLGALQALPQDGKPVIQWSHPDTALENVAQGVSEVVTKLLAKLKQEAIRQQKGRELDLKIKKEDMNYERLRQYKSDLEYTLESKEQSEIQLLNQLATLREEMDQIENLAEKTKSSMASSHVHLKALYEEYKETVGQWHLNQRTIRPPWSPSPSQLLTPPFKPRDEKETERPAWMEYY